MVSSPKEALEDIGIVPCMLVLVELQDEDALNVFLHSGYCLFWPVTYYRQSDGLSSPTSSLAHRSMSDSDTICNSPSLLLANIVHFCPLCISVRLMVCPPL